MSAALTSSAAIAQPVTSANPESVSVTIYRAPDRGPDAPMNLGWLQGYALVTERRTVVIPAGRATIRFENVAAGMLPESAIVTGLPAGVREKNLDADLLSPRNLYARAFGRPVTLRRTSRASGAVTEERAVIRSSPDGAAILQTAAGFEAVNCGPLNDALVYDGVPDGLPARPTLSIETEAQAATRVTLTLSYLAWGFDWQANYVMQMRPGGRTADLFAWVTLASSDATSFPAAEAAVVAGKINREDRRDYSYPQPQYLVFRCPVREPALPPPPPPAPASPMREAFASAEIVVTGTARRAAPVQMAQQEELGDIKLYRIPRPTDVAANAQKQVAMIDRESVKVEVYYGATIHADSIGTPMLSVRAQNRDAAGLGLPLPAGKMAVFEAHQGQAVLIGEGSLDDKAVGEEVEVEVAQATQVTATVETVDRSADRNGYVVRVRNANPRPVRFEAAIILASDQRIERPSERIGRKDGRPYWRKTVPANGSAELRYTVARLE